MRWKRVRQSLEKRRPVNYTTKLAELKKLETQSKQGKHKLYYGDGSSFSLVPTVPYAWQAVGTRIELPCFRSKTLSLFGIWDAQSDLEMYSVEGSLTSRCVISYIDDFCKGLTDKTVLVLDNAPIHTSKVFIDKEKEWLAKGLEIFKLPTYSPHLNLIEHLWRFMKYEWIDFKAYLSWENLLEYIDNIVKNFGTEYTIKFE